MIGDLERRLSAAQRPAERRRAAAGSEDHRRRVAVSRMSQERDRQLAADPSPLRLRRLDANMSQRALSILASVSRDAVSRAELHPDRVSMATWRRLAAALNCRVEDIRP